MQSYLAGHHCEERRAVLDPADDPETPVVIVDFGGLAGTGTSLLALA